MNIVELVVELERIEKAMRFRDEDLVHLAPERLALLSVQLREVRLALMELQVYKKAAQ